MALSVTGGNLVVSRLDLCPLYRAFQRSIASCHRSSFLQSSCPLRGEALGFPDACVPECELYLLPAFWIEYCDTFFIAILSDHHPGFLEGFAGCCPIIGRAAIGHDHDSQTFIVVGEDVRLSDPARDDFSTFIGSSSDFEVMLNCELPYIH